MEYWTRTNILSVGYSCIVASPRECYCVTDQFTYESTTENMLVPNDQHPNDEEPGMIDSLSSPASNEVDAVQTVLTVEATSTFSPSKDVPRRGTGELKRQLSDPAMPATTQNDNFKERTGNDKELEDCEMLEQNDLFCNEEPLTTHSDETGVFDMTDILDNLDDKVFVDKTPRKANASGTEEKQQAQASTEDELEVFHVPNPVRRSRSDTDNGCVTHAASTVRRRKSVHFADSRGLDLEVRISFKQDDHNVPPRLKEALDKVRAQVDGEPSGMELYAGGSFDTVRTHFSLNVNFQQPFLDPSFQRRISSQNVCLESISILPFSLSLTGVIRVVNLEFQKQVFVRYTANKWRSFSDIPACFVSTVHNFNQDQFSFHCVAPSDIQSNDVIEMAVGYRLPLSGRTFWDNNNGRNYAISYVEHHATHSDTALMT
uniref:uncharacterized protein LOC100187165 isoform X2 n=1 Tax=Ciona intestinalis TaxID=7719 RepID=UPI00005211AE|nr:uncharacterized protein LOC100187165 isoform X2 [Ciona intestinalis]|eukprot:XP_004225847.1 uncharacterized protein LOC100187165 isoform X2 [Ciona intestinalis]